MAPVLSVTSKEYDVIEDEQIPCLLNRRIHSGRYQLEKRLGSGGYSVVYLALDLAHQEKYPDDDPVRVAIKCVLHRTPSQVLKNLTEFRLHRRVSTFTAEGVVRLHGIVEEDGLLFFFMDLCVRGDLFRAITETKIFLGHDHTIKFAFLQLLDAVADIHSLGVYHRDLKPENILLGARPCGAISVRISDFGMSTLSDRTSDFGCGSYFYMSPECVTGFVKNGLPAYSSRAADIWALGVILLNMIFSRLPWKVATPSDSSFQCYMSDPNWLKELLPMSEEVFQFVHHIFSTHGNTKPLARLREDFLKIETFYVNGQGLDRAEKSARFVARDWIKDAPTEDITEEDIENMIIMDNISLRELFLEKDDNSMHRRLQTSSSQFSDISNDMWATARTRPSLSLSSERLALSPELAQSDTLALTRLEAQDSDSDSASDFDADSDADIEISISIETSLSSTAYTASNPDTRVGSLFPSPAHSHSSHGVGELADSESGSTSSGSISPFPITPETHAAAAAQGAAQTADADVDVDDLSDDALGGSLNNAAGQWLSGAAKPAVDRMDLAVLDKALAAVEETDNALRLTVVE